MAHLDEFRLATVGFLVLWWEFRALAKPNVKLDGSFQHDEDLTPQRVGYALGTKRPR